MSKQDNSDLSPNNVENELPEVQQELSKVAANPKQSIIILLAICGIFGYLFFNFFISNKGPTQDVKVATPTEITKPTQTVISEVPSIPQLPEPPKLVDPVLPSPEPDNKQADIPPPPSNNLPLPTNDASPLSNNSSSVSSPLPSTLVDNEAAKKRKEAKRKSSIVLVAGSAPKKTPEQIEQEADFKERGDMELVLGRGKIIDGVLETAINSDLPGEIRAVISRDIYSESGKIILIPKGSRVFGTFAVSTTDAYGRVNITWNRIDLASGYTINLQGAGVDALGRKGDQGRVDNKIKERLFNAVLMSAFNIAIAKTIDKVVTPVTNSETATANTAAAGQLNTIALGIYNDTTTNAATKIPLICTQVQAAIPDKTSTAYTNFVAACTNLSTATGSTPDQNLTSLMASVNTAATALLTNTAAATTPTKAQDASTQAFKDITNTVKEIITQNEFKPTITIDQGTNVKIYVNKDYKFPKKALIRSKLMQ